MKLKLRSKLAYCGETENPIFQISLLLAVAYQVVSWEVWGFLATVRTGVVVVVVGTGWIWATWARGQLRVVYPWMLLSLPSQAP